VTHPRDFAHAGAADVDPVPGLDQAAKVEPQGRLVDLRPDRAEIVGFEVSGKRLARIDRR